MFSSTTAKPRSDDRYQLIDKIGEGGMGQVWRAFDTKFKTDVALKTLLDDFNEEALKLFNDEIKKLTQLEHHPQITSIKDFGEKEYKGKLKPFFVMPLLQGVTLAELLNPAILPRERREKLLSQKTALAEFLSRNSERLPVELVVEIITQTCKGLQAAHLQGVIHRDIKPSNIFLLTDFSVQIIDFGIARQADASAIADSSTSNLWLKGTPRYMSPEQIQFRPLTAASDIFSLGVVCYEAMSGARPFNGDSPEKVCDAIERYNPKPLREVAPVGIAISQAVYKSMAKQTENRYFTASEFGEHLVKALRLGDTELFPLPRPRLNLAVSYYDKEDFEAAAGLLRSIQAEGITHPDITELQSSVDLALRRRRIEKGIATAHSLLEVRDYAQALREVEKVLTEDPDNSQAVAIRDDTNKRRTDDSIEELFRDALRHLNTFEFESARRTLAQIAKLRPKEPRLPQFKAGLDRADDQFEYLKRERKLRLAATQNALEKQDISSAHSNAEKLRQLAALHPDAPDPDRSVYESICLQVESEWDAIESSLNEAKRLGDAKEFDAALAICQKLIIKYPNHERPQILRFQIQELQRDAIAVKTREAESYLRTEPDLWKQEQQLARMVDQYPNEGYFQRALESIRQRRGFVEQTVNRAKEHESRNEFQEAGEEWRKLKTIYPYYPHLDAELERVSQLRGKYEKRQRRDDLVVRIGRLIDRRDFEAALDAIQQADPEFQADPDFIALQKSAQQGIEKAEAGLDQSHPTASTAVHEPADQSWTAVMAPPEPAPATPPKSLPKPTPVVAPVSKEAKPPKPPAFSANGFPFKKETLRTLIWALVTAVVLPVAWFAFHRPAKPVEDKKKLATAAIPDIDFKLLVAPEDAQTKVDGQLLTTKQLHFPPGTKHDVIVSRLGYQPFQGQQTADGKAWFITLQPEPLHVDISAPSTKGIVFLDNHKTADLREGSFSIDVPVQTNPQPHTIRVMVGSRRLFFFRYTLAAGTLPQVDPFDAKGLLITSSLGKDVISYTRDSVEPSTSADASAGNAPLLKVSVLQPGETSEHPGSKANNHAAKAKTPAKAAASADAATLIIRKSTPLADVFVDDQLFATTDNNGNLNKLGIDPGWHDLDIRKPPLEHHSLRAQFFPGKTLFFPGEDLRLKAKTALGHVTLGVNPPAARASVRIKYRKLEGNWVSVPSLDRALDLAPGDYEFEAEADNYLPASQHMTVDESSVPTVWFYLKPKS